jgi:hypothetical protein
MSAAARDADAAPAAMQDDQDSRQTEPEEQEAQVTILLLPSESLIQDETAELAAASEEVHQTSHS